MLLQIVLIVDLSLSYCFIVYVAKIQHFRELSRGKGVKYC
nr:hypothetical protein SEWZTGNK_SEWZTGNK_CDS_0006 [Microvirus sp.]